MHYYIFFILKAVRIGQHFMVIVFKLRQRRQPKACCQSCVYEKTSLKASVKGLLIYWALYFYLGLRTRSWTEAFRLVVCINAEVESLLNCILLTHSLKTFNFIILRLQLMASPFYY